MNTTHQISIALVVLGLLAGVGSADAQQAVRVLPPQPGDLVPTQLVTAADVAKVAADLERQPVTFSWPVAADQPLDLGAHPADAVSTSYWLEVSAAELHRGVTLPTAERGAFVRINPARPVDSGQRHAIDPENLELTTPDKAAMEAGRGMVMLAGVDELKEAGAPFPEGTAAFRIDPELGSGSFTLRAPALERARTPYVVHVLERDSTVALSLRSDQPTYLSGQRIAAAARLTDGDTALAIDSASAVLVAPDGRTWPMELASEGTGVSRAEAVPETIGDARGLWEVVVRLTGSRAGQQVRRDVRTALAVVQPTARLTGTATVSSTAKAGLTIELGVETATEGRYEVRGVLFGTDKAGQLLPMGVAHSAAWLGAGFDALELSFGTQVLAGSDLGAPYEVRDLQLIDQGRMGIVHRQLRGILVRR